MLYVVESPAVNPLDERDYFLVEAPNKKSAMWQAWRFAKENRTSWWWAFMGVSEIPIHGCTAEDGFQEDPEDWGAYFVDYTSSPNPS